MAGNAPAETVRSPGLVDSTLGMDYPSDVKRAFKPLALGILVAAATVVGVTLAGCAAEAEISKPISYERTARANYEKGLEALRREEGLRSAKYFAYVKTKFPYSEYATYADLRLADSAFARGEVNEAIDGYKLFVKYHPTSKFVPYASFRVGLSLHSQIPGDWFLVPPSHEKDQTAVIDALRSLLDYVARWPKHEMVPEAKELIADCKKRLAKHEWYVARFYWKRKKYKATANRLRGLLKSYGGVGFDEKAHYLLVSSLSRLGEDADACTAYNAMRKALPGESATDRAGGLLRTPCEGTPAVGTPETEPAGAAASGPAASLPTIAPAAGE